MGVAVTLKSKMAASCPRSGGNSKIMVLKAQANRLSLFKFPASGKYDAVLDSFVTTTTTMHVRAAKALSYVILH